ncbi:MAG: hypothetical protein E7B29_22745, partial [Mixta calida]|nr:hypothetical protein [Mixta calida]
LFMSKYLTYLPTKEQLKREIERQKEIFYMQHPASCILHSAFCGTDCFPTASKRPLKDKPLPEYHLRRPPFIPHADRRLMPFSDRLARHSAADALCRRW